MKTKNIEKLAKKKKAMQLMIQGNLQEYINYIYGMTLATAK